MTKNDLECITLYSADMKFHITLIKTSCSVLQPFTGNSVTITSLVDDT